MKKFKFTLESVHRVREMRQEQEMLALRELQLQAENAAENARRLEERRLEAMRAYAQRLRSREAMSPIEMELSFNHFAALNRRQQEANRHVEERRMECTKQGAAVAAAVSQVKVTNKLKDNQHSRYELDRSRREQNDLDELVSTRFAKERNKNK